MFVTRHEPGHDPGARRARTSRTTRLSTEPLSGAGDSARSDVPAGRRSALGALSAWLLPPRGLGRTSRRTGDLAARTYPGPGDDHPIRMMSALCASA